MNTRRYSIRAIARALERSTSTIAHELTRNRVGGIYDPRKAHHKAYVRRKYSKYQGMKIVEHDGLRRFVRASLLDNHSPEAVAGRLRRGESSLPVVSSRTIRRFVKSIHGRSIELALWRKRKRRMRRSGRPQTIPNRVMIDQRPRHMSTRSRIGDAEADFIVSGKTGRGLLLVVVDRRTRHAFLERILPVTIVNVECAFVRIKMRFPEMRSVTTDNDILFRHHERLAHMLKVQVFFCHPYHSWEKGSVENTNRAIRRDIPKGSDISRCTPQFICAVEARLNRRPMAVLAYQTPAEVLALHRKLSRKTKKPR